MAAGSAGTICGLAIAKYLSGAKIKSVAATNVVSFAWSNLGDGCPGINAGLSIAGSLGGGNQTYSSTLVLFT